MGRAVAVRRSPKLSLENSHGEGGYAAETARVPAHLGKHLAAKLPRAGEPDFKTTASGGGELRTVSQPLTLPLQKR